MDAVGVDAAIIVSTFNLYRYDPSYALEVYRKYPDRFRVVKPIDVTDSAIDDVCAAWAKTNGAVGVRIMLRDELVSDPADARLNGAFAAAGKHGLPVNFLCWGRLDDGAELIRRNPDTVIVIDHLGLLQPNQPPVSAEPWADLPKLLALGSKSAVPAHYRASHSHTTTSGSRSCGSSTHLASTAVCGALIGQEPVEC